jgi:hypothetical protein
LYIGAVWSWPDVEKFKNSSDFQPYLVLYIGVSLLYFPSAFTAALVVRLHIVGMLGPIIQQKVRMFG